MFEIRQAPKDALRKYFQSFFSIERHTATHTRLWLNKEGLMDGRAAVISPLLLRICRALLHFRSDCEGVVTLRVFTTDFQQCIFRLLPCAYGVYRTAASQICVWIAVSQVVGGTSWALSVVVVQNAILFRAAAAFSE